MSPMPMGGSANMAAGGGMPQQMQGPGGGGPPGGMTTTVGPGGAATTQINEILNALKKIIPQVINQQGFVDLDKLTQLWPQFSKVPLQVVFQLISQNPDILTEIITQYGLAGVILQGRVIPAQELANLGGGQ